MKIVINSSLLGYSYPELQQIIEDHRPSTLSLKELLDIPSMTKS